MTEYEDGKAARVLTAMAFLSALAVGLHNLTLNNSSRQWALLLVINCAYLLFYGKVVWGSWVLVKAILPSFNIPKWQEKHPFSLVFAPEIVRVELDEWIKQFTDRTGPELEIVSIRNEILEARLVAEKCEKKILQLKDGMNHYLGAFKIFGVALAISAYALLIHPLIFGVIFPPKPTVQPSQSLLIIDADNTLWATNDVYVHAQTTLANELAKDLGVPPPPDPVAFVRSIEETLAVGRGFNLPAGDVANAVAVKLRQGQGKGPLVVTDAVRAEISAAAADYERALGRSPICIRAWPKPSGASRAKATGWFCLAKARRSSWTSGFSITI